MDKNMKHFIVLLLMAVFCCGNVFAQHKQTVTVKVEKANLKQLFAVIENQTTYHFSYRDEIIDNRKDITVNMTKVSVEKVLDKALQKRSLAYRVVSEKSIVVYDKETVTKMSNSKPALERKIFGRVLDNMGEPVIGASVMIKGTGSGSVTDINGSFNLLTDKKRVTLAVSYIGFESQDVVSEGTKELNIMLKPKDQLLEEVVVTGYGTYKKSAYAGSASTIKTSQLKDVPAVSFSGLLQGAAPGIQISSSSGQPGSATSINIRGMGSFNASNSPLYVIDGVPTMSGNVSTLDTDAGLDIMSTINTSDIENITVIKDAAAASLYGSRAANGVILITTKKGKVGKPSVAFKSDWGFSDFAMDYRPIMSGEQRREYIYNGLKAGQIINNEATEEEAIKYADENIDKYAPIPWCGYVDWDDILFRV